MSDDKYLLEIVLNRGDGFFQFLKAGVVLGAESLINNQGRQRRAGAPLPTLIIDEGFGTQDNAGLEKLKEAITSIQDDFKKILVVTHIEELRDAFPTRIDVRKTAEGSIIEVN